MQILLIISQTLIKGTYQFFITSGHCQKNISVKYQVPITKTRLSLSDNANEINHYQPQYHNQQQQQHIEQYIAYEEHIRWDVVQICCPGYRTIIFGFCEPICEDACPPHSVCIEPNTCGCIRGYEPSHHSHTQQNKNHHLICHPVCIGGCPEHSHCVGHNECDCRAGYKDVSAWFSPLRCERIQCGHDQRYDLHRHACVKIEMSMEELMQKVAEKLAQGLNADNNNATEPETELDLDVV